MKKMKTFPSKVDPEISPKDQDLKIDPDNNTPKAFNVSFTQDEINFLNGLIGHDRGSPLWYTKIHRIRMILQSIAHQINIDVKRCQVHKSLRKRFVDNEFTIESPFV